MQFDVVTLFPEMFRALTDWGITSRAVKQERFGLRTWNPRDFTTDNYRTIDDRPYGGGPGMVMLAGRSKMRSPRRKRHRRSRALRARGS